MIACGRKECRSNVSCDRASLAPTRVFSICILISFLFFSFFTILVIVVVYLLGTHQVRDGSCGG